MKLSAHCRHQGVHAAAPVRRRPAVAAGQGVVPAVAGQGVPLGAPVDALDPRQPVQALARGGPGGEIDHHRRARQHVGRDVDPRPALDPVLAVAAGQGVVAAAAEDLVLAGVAVEVVAAPRADEQVALGRADDVLDAAHDVGAQVEHDAPRIVAEAVEAHRVVAAAAEEVVARDGDPVAVLDEVEVEGVVAVAAVEELPVNTSWAAARPARPGPAHRQAADVERVGAVAGPDVGPAQLGVGGPAGAAGGGIGMASVRRDGQGDAFVRGPARHAVADQLGMGGPAGARRFRPRRSRRRRWRSAGWPRPRSPTQPHCRSPAPWPRRRPRRRRRARRPCRPHRRRRPRRRGRRRWSPSG